MDEHPNVTATRSGLEAFVKGDVETLTALMADDVTWHAPGSNRFSGDFAGKAAVMGRMGEMRQSGVTIAFDIHDVVGNDEHVVALVEATVTNASGGSSHGRQVQVFHLRDGTLTEFWGYNEDQAAVDAVING